MGNTHQPWDMFGNPNVSEWKYIVDIHGCLQIEDYHALESQLVTGIYWGYNFLLLFQQDFSAPNCCRKLSLSRMTKIKSASCFDSALPGTCSGNAFFMRGNHGKD